MNAFEDQIKLLLINYGRFIMRSDGMQPEAREGKCKRCRRSTTASTTFGHEFDYSLEVIQLVLGERIGNGSEIANNNRAIEV